MVRKFVEAHVSVRKGSNIFPCMFEWGQEVFGHLLFPNIAFEIVQLHSHKLVATDLSWRLAGKTGKNSMKERGFLSLDW